MKAVVVYESMYGNTKLIAEAVAQGVASFAEVQFGSVDEIRPDDVHGVDLIVAGGPTHAHGMARADAHEAVAKMPARDKYPPVLPGTESLRRWLDKLPENGGRAAAFDTRFDKPRWLTGSAAMKIARRFERRGYSVAGVESFFVEHTGGPLSEGEIGRAVSWGEELGSSQSAGLMPETVSG